MNPEFGAPARQRHALLARAVGALAAGLTALVLSGCAGPQLADYAGQRPGFDFKQYFNGTVRAHGLVSERGGKVLRRFVVTMRCTWVDDVGTLDEAFEYDDGERQQRIWRVQKLPDGRYSGRADDVVGTAEGAESGAAFRWQYTLRVPVRGSERELRFDDWMYRVDERTVINRAAMHYFGVRVGEVTLSFSKP